METVNVVELLKKSQRNLEWFGTHRDELIERFEDQFVAIDNEHVIEVDNDFDSLLQKLKSKNMDPSKVLIKFISKIKSIL